MAATVNIRWRPASAENVRTFITTNAATLSRDPRGRSFDEAVSART